MLQIELFHSAIGYHRNEIGVGILLTSWNAYSQVPAQSYHCQVTGPLPKKQKKYKCVHTINVLYIRKCKSHIRGPRLTFVNAPVGSASIRTCKTNYSSNERYYLK